MCSKDTDVTLAFLETYSLSMCCSQWMYRGHCHHDCSTWRLFHSEQLEIPLEIKRKASTVTSVLLKKQPKYWEIWNTFLHSIHLTNNHEDPTPAKIAFCRLSGWVKWRQHLLSHRTVIWFLLKYLPTVTQVLELKYSNNYLAYLNSQNSILTSFFKKKRIFSFFFPLSSIKFR